MDFIQFSTVNEATIVIDDAPLLYPKLILLSLHRGWTCTCSFITVVHASPQKGSLTFPSSNNFMARTSQDGKRHCFPFFTCMGWRFPLHIPIK